MDGKRGKGEQQGEAIFMADQQEWFNFNQFKARFRTAGCTSKHFLTIPKARASANQA